MSNNNKSRFIPDIKTYVNWSCLITGETLVGEVVGQLTNSAIVRVTNVHARDLDKYKLASDTTNVAYKRLKPHNSHLLI